jgi:hypothetical protein
LQVQCRLSAAGRTIYLRNIRAVDAFELRFCGDENGGVSLRRSAIAKVSRIENVLEGTVAKGQKELFQRGFTEEVAEFKENQ